MTPKMTEREKCTFLRSWKSSFPESYKNVLIILFLAQIWWLYVCISQYRSQAYCPDAIMNLHG